MDIASVIADVKASAELNSSEIRVIETMDVGISVRQGDIYIHRVADDFPKGEKTLNNQLAEGSSKGSRHYAEIPAVVYAGTKRPGYCTHSLIGPFVVSTERFVVSHPEHPHISLPAGSYQVTHQMDARTLARVRD